MRDDDLIEPYLEELDAQLRLPRWARRRIVAEARDHLRQLVGGTGEDDAAAQSRAIVAFGAPVVVATRFAYELAIGATRRAARTGAAMFMLALVLWDLCTSSFIHVAPAWVNDGPGSALLWIIGQVGLVAGITSPARARIARRADAADTVRLRYVVRGLLVVSICTGLTVATAVAGVPQQHGNTHRGAQFPSAAGRAHAGVRRRDCDQRRRNVAGTSTPRLAQWRAHRAAGRHRRAGGQPRRAHTRWGARRAPTRPTCRLRAEH